MGLSIGPCMILSADDLVPARSLLSRHTGYGLLPSPNILIKRLVDLALS